MASASASAKLSAMRCDSYTACRRARDGNGDVRTFGCSVGLCDGPLADTLLLAASHTAACASSTLLCSSPLQPTTTRRLLRLFHVFALSTCSASDWSLLRAPRPHFQLPAQSSQALRSLVSRRLWRSRSTSSAWPSALTCPLRTARNCSHSSASTTTRSACCSCATFTHL